MGSQPKQKRGEQSDLGCLMRNVPAALAAVKAGLLSCGRWEKNTDSPVRAAAAKLHYEAAVHLLRILFLLYADGRGYLRMGTSGPARSMRELATLETRRSPTRDSGERRGDGEFFLWRQIEELLGILDRRAGGHRAEDTGSLLCPDHCGTVSKIPDSYLRRVLQLLGMNTGARSAYARLDVRGLGDTYELVMSWNGRRPRSEGRGTTPDASIRKTTGRYYTPDHIIRYVARAALSRLVKGLSSKQILGIRVLDPAVGSGHFLLGAADFLAGAYGRSRAREGKAKHGLRIPAGDLKRYRQLVIGRCLYGVDTDPLAVELARCSLWLEAGATPEILGRLQQHLRCGDALLGRSPHPSRFDAIIGNPPYVSLSGRQKPASSRRPAAIPRPAAAQRGWPSLHGLFILRATELINGRGTISLIAPAQVGLLPGYAPVRSGLLDVCDVIEVRYWGEGVFKRVTTPALTFTAARRGVYPVRNCRLVLADGTARRFRPDGPGPWYASPGRRTLDRMTDLHGSVDTFSDPGVHTGNVARGLLMSRPGPSSVPILEGRQIRAFRCDPPRRWLDIDYRCSAGEYFRISDDRTYENTDIVIRQTARRPVAARHEHRCHFRNSVLALKAPPGFSVEYLLGILNSDVAAMLYQAGSPDCLQRTFPQLKVNALKRLPIPDPRIGHNRQAVARIERVVRSLEARVRQERGMDRLLARLNQLVRRLYGLETVEG